MAVQTFRHAAMLFPSGYHLPDRPFATLCNPALEERIHARRMSGRSSFLHDRFPSLTAIRNGIPRGRGYRLRWPAGRRFAWTGRCSASFRG